MFRAMEVFNIPENLVGVMIAIGYQDTHDILPEFKTKGNLYPEKENCYLKSHFSGS